MCLSKTLLFCVEVKANQALEVQHYMHYIKSGQGFSFDQMITPHYTIVDRMGL